MEYDHAPRVSVIPEEDGYIFETNRPYWSRKPRDWPENGGKALEDFFVDSRPVTDPQAASSAGVDYATDADDSRVGVRGGTVVQM